MKDGKSCLYVEAIATEVCLPDTVPVQLSVTTGMEKIHNSVALRQIKIGWQVGDYDNRLKQITLPLRIRPLRLVVGSHREV